jgi:hypothetical protein
MLADVTGVGQWTLRLFHAGSISITDGLSATSIRAPPLYFAAPLASHV